MKKEISFTYKGKRINVKARKCGFSSTGLMFRTKNTDPCLFEISNFKIGSFWVFFPFIAVWLDKSNKIVDLKTVKPFTFSVSTTRPFSKIVEIPISKKYSKIVQLLDGN